MRPARYFSIIQLSNARVRCSRYVKHCFNKTCLSASAVSKQYHVSYFVRSVNLHAAASLYVVILPTIFSVRQAHHGYIVLKLRCNYNYFIHFSHTLFIVYFYDVKC